MGRFFLFREVRPRGDVSGNLGLLKRLRYKGQSNIPSSQVTTKSR
jgi:hypothetical protein